MINCNSFFSFTVVHHFFTSLHFFTSFLLFISSLHFFSSFLHFISSLHFFTSLLNFISSLHFFLSFLHFISSLHFFTSFLPFISSFLPFISSLHFFTSFLHFILTPSQSPVKHTFHFLLSRIPTLLYFYANTHEHTHRNRHVPILEEALTHSLLLALTNTHFLSFPQSHAPVPGA